MPRGGFGVAVIASVLWWSPFNAGRLEAATAAQAVNLLPRAMDREDASSVLSDGLGAPVVLVPPDPRLVEDLRWAAPDPAARSCQERVPQLIEQVSGKKFVKETPTAARLFEALIKQATGQILFVDLKGALESLGQAREVLPCSPDIVQREQVRALFLNEAVAHLLLKDGQDREAFLNVLAVDPRVYLEEDYSPKIRNEYLEAAKYWSRVPPVQNDRADLDGEYFLDGQPVASLEYVRPGRHVVQARGPTGQVRTALVHIANGLTSVRISTLAEFGLPGSSQVRERLAMALLDRRLQPEQQQALEALVAAREPRSMVFAVPGRDGAPPVLRLYLSGAAVEEYTRAGLAEGHGAVGAPAGEIGQGELLPADERRKGAGLRLQVGIGLQLLPGTPRATYANNVSAGTILHVALPLHPVMIQGRLAFFPHALRLVDPGCGGASGVDPDEQDLEGAVGCLPIHPAFEAGIGGGLPISLSDRLTLVPSLYGSAAYASEIVVVPEVSHVSSARVYDALMVGPLVQGRLTYEVAGSERKLDVGLELEAGVRFAVTGDDRFMALPLGGSVVGGLTF